MEDRKSDGIGHGAWGKALKPKMMRQ
jgi:hypothetical protein